MIPMPMMTSFVRSGWNQGLEDVRQAPRYRLDQKVGHSLSVIAAIKIML